MALLQAEKDTAPLVPPHTDWEGRAERIERMRALEDDWNGEGAEAPKPEIVDGALRLLRELEKAGLPCPATAGAGPNGTVCLAWNRGVRYFEIMTGPDGIEWFRAVGKEPPAVGASEAEALRQLAEWAKG